MSAITIRDFTDPRCPWAYSAEPSRWRLRWLFGDQIRWEPRMVVLSERRDDDDSFNPEIYSAGLRGFVRRFGMPIDTRHRAHRQVTTSSGRACAAAAPRPGRARRVGAPAGGATRARAMRSSWPAAAPGSTCRASSR